MNFDNLGNPIPPAEVVTPVVTSVSAASSSVLVLKIVAAVVVVGGLGGGAYYYTTSNVQNSPFGTQEADNTTIDQSSAPNELSEIAQIETPVAEVVAQEATTSKPVGIVATVAPEINVKGIQCGVVRATTGSNPDNPIVTGDSKCILDLITNCKIGAGSIDDSTADQVNAFYEVLGGTKDACKVHIDIHPKEDPEFGFNFFCTAPSSAYNVRKIGDMNIVEPPNGNYCTDKNGAPVKSSGF